MGDFLLIQPKLSLFSLDLLIRGSSILSSITHPHPNFTLTVGLVTDCADSLLLAICYFIITPDLVLCLWLSPISFPRSKITQTLPEGWLRPPETGDKKLSAYLSESAP